VSAADVSSIQVVSIADIKQTLQFVWVLWSVENPDTWIIEVAVDELN